MKQWMCGCLIAIGIWPSPLLANTLFQKMTDEFAKQAIQEFIGLVAKNERYPLLHLVTKLRFRILVDYLEIRQPRDTKPCSLRRNKGTKVSPKKKEFCRRYDETIDAAKQGLANLDLFEKIYFKYEPLLLRTIEREQARDPMREWIRRKVRCLNEKTWCGKDEQGVVTRVTAWEPNLIRMYTHILENLEKKLFPEDAKLTFINEEVIDSPCSSSGRVRGIITDHGMAFIPAGTFAMGNKSELARPDEKPPHAVELDAFWIDRCEVTNLDFLKFLANDPYLRKSTLPRQFHDGDYLKEWASDLKPPQNRDNYPVVYVSWYAARYYCQSNGKRLPSEAEWERAARAGTFTDYSFGADVAELAEYAWYNSNSENHLRLVADRKPNKFQLYDMHGNVWEWVYDWYAPYAKGRVKNPQGPSRGKYRVLRGGSWLSPAEHLRSSMRGDDSPVNTSGDVGFRCAATTHPEKGRLVE